MSSCNEFIELVSAYADGELNESDKRRLEEHMDACEACSSLLELYRDISVAADDSCIPPPDSLSRAVMDVVLSEAVPASITDAIPDGKKRNVLRIVLTRYVPAAACLAVLLLTLPRLSNLGCSSSGPGYRNESAMMDSSTQMNFETGSANDVTSGAAPEAAPGAGMDGGGPVMAGGGSPSMAPELIPAPEEYGEEAIDDADSGFAPTQESVPDIDANTEPVEAGDEAGETFAGLSEFQETSTDRSDNGVGSTEPTWTEDEAAEAPPPPEPGRPEASSTPEPVSAGANEADDSQDQDGGAMIMTEAIYAIISIEGGLPDFLIMYGLDPMDDVAMYYEIPRDIAERVIEFVRDLDGVKVTIIDESGSYAIFMYTPDD